MNMISHKSNAEVIDLLASHGVNPTIQRIIVMQTILEHCAHLSAEELYQIIEQSPGRQGVALATVYNTLSLFAEKGLVREVIADPSRVFYDPNTSPHHHVYNVTTGELIDVDADRIKVSGLPSLPPGTNLEGVDVIVRVRSPS